MQGKAKPAASRPPKKSSRLQEKNVAALAELYKKQFVNGGHNWFKLDLRDKVIPGDTLAHHKAFIIDVHRLVPNFSIPKRRHMNALTAGFDEGKFKVTDENKAIIIETLDKRLDKLFKNLARKLKYMTFDMWVQKTGQPEKRAKNATADQAVKKQDHEEEEEEDDTAEDEEEEEEEETGNQQEPG